MEKKPLKYEIKLVTENDIEAVLDHLRKFFFIDEPLNTYVKLIDVDSPTCVELEQYCKENIYENNSLTAVSSTGDIIGVCLNGTLEADDNGNGAERCPNEKFAKILRLLEYFVKVSRPSFEKRCPKASEVLNVRILSTDGAWRGHGIAGALIMESRKIARKQGYKFIRTDCSSHFSARVLSKLGFERVHEFQYEDYLENGEVAFKLPQPHTCVALYIQSTTSP